MWRLWDFDVLFFWLTQAAFLWSLPILSTVRVGDFTFAQPPTDAHILSISSFVLSPISGGVFGFFSGWYASLVYYQLQLRGVDLALFVLSALGIVGVICFPLSTGLVHGFFTGLSITMAMLLCARLAWRSGKRYLHVAVGALLLEAIASHVTHAFSDRRGYLYYATEVLLLLTTSFVVCERVVAARLPPEGDA